MKIKRIIFPEKSRDFTGQRWIRIILRTTHLVGITGMAGAFFNKGFTSSTSIYLWLVLISGFSFFALDVWTNGVCLIQLRGIALYLKFSLLALLFFSPYFQVPALFTVVIISGVISHAPGHIRYYSLFHGKKIESLPDSN